MDDYLVVLELRSPADYLGNEIHEIIWFLFEGELEGQLAGLGLEFQVGNGEK